MTKDEALKLALYALENDPVSLNAINNAKCFLYSALEQSDAIEAAVLAEREACAKVCDERERANLYGVKECAAAIRERMK